MKPTSDLYGAGKQRALWIRAGNALICHEKLARPRPAAFAAARRCAASQHDLRDDSPYTR
jgi:hypothetical protein